MKFASIFKFSLFIAAFVIAIAGVYAGGNQVDSTAMVAEHNKWRSEAGLSGLKWSEKLAKTAQGWADTLKSRSCAFEHSTGAGYGENIFWASPAKSANSKDANGNWIWRVKVQDITPRDVVDSWGSEKQWYNYEANSCSAPKDKSCGHYTQIVWKRTTEVGCGMAVCSDQSQIWVCNYNPPGNYVGQKPY